MDDPSNLEHFVNAYHNTTTLDPVGVSVFLVLAAMMLFVKRRQAMLPLLLVVSILSLSLRVVVGGLDFNFLRLMVLVGFVRVLWRGEWRGVRLHELDYAFVVSVAYGYGMAALRIGTASYFVSKLGNMFDAFGIYFLCRCLIRSWRDVDQLGKGVSIVSLLICVPFVIEWQTSRNHFSFFGGVAPYTPLHHGEQRAKGAFSHGLVAGCFILTLFPIAVARWWNPAASRTLVLATVAAVIAIILAVSSSTPILGMAACLGAALMFPLRFQLQWIRWSVFGMLVLLHLVMNAPVWHLMARVNVFAGSTGWHRYNLIDQFIAHFHEWWLMGTKYTGHWGNNLVDLTNTFVKAGVQGGLVNLVIYVCMFALAFRRVGLTMRWVDGDRRTMAFAWALGVALFAHTTVHFAISYFGEMLLAFYGTLAAVASVSAASAPRRVARPARRTRQDARPASGGAPAPLGAGAPLLPSRGVPASVHRR